jgi:hypothetical protein
MSAVLLKSIPGGAGVTVDDKYVGTTESSIKLPAGDHEVVIEKAGYRAWKRTVAPSVNGNITLEATLEKLP